MASIEQSIQVNVPVRTAYNQWTQFEEFPRFMEGVESVRQLDDKRLQWQVNIGGKTKEWVAEITEQRPDERIAWTSRGGAYNAGVVTFHRLDDAAPGRLQPRGRGRESRRRSWARVSADQGGPTTLQGVYRVSPHRDRRVARGDRARAARPHRLTLPPVLAYSLRLSAWYHEAVRHFGASATLCHPTAPELWHAALPYRVYRSKPKSFRTSVSIAT
jgi:hypothetical protein